MILEQAGFDVTAALGFAEAMEHCSANPTFHLIVMGHSMPRKDKTALIKTLRPTCKSPVLSVRKHGDAPLPEANASVDSYDGPAKLIQAVKSTIAAAGKSASATSEG
ncbi:MAG: hypothetical protein JWO13_3181 [Acidobacteriales bacterium]|nr:hypothetical protein [Terriglobales bacterium]